MTNRSHIIAPDRSFFCVGQCRKGDGSGGGTIFDAEFAEDAFDVLLAGAKSKPSTLIADAHRGDGKRFVVHADELLTAFVELESAICAGRELV